MSKKISRRQFLKLGLAGSFLIASYPILIERYMIMVNTYRIGFKNLPQAFHGFRIAHLTDLHYGSLMPDFIIQNVVNRVNRLDIDVIACTGDYVHEDDSTEQIDTVWPILSQLKAKNGVYSVLGNHDHWADTDRSLYWLERSGQNIRHRSQAIEKNGQRIWLAGTGDLWEDDLGIDEALSAVPDDEFKIILTHNPDMADQNYNHTIDFILAGHTHGGQVRLPFLGAPMVPVNNKSYTSGIFSTKNGTLFISRGIGWAILPIRFNCTPEIAILELVQTI